MKLGKLQSPTPGVLFAELLCSLLLLPIVPNQLYLCLSILYSPGPIDPVIVLLKSVLCDRSMTVDAAFLRTAISRGEYDAAPGSSSCSFGYFLFGMAPPFVDKVGIVQYSPGPGTVLARTVSCLGYLAKVCILLVWSSLCSAYLSGLGCLTIAVCQMGVRFDTSITPLGIRLGSRLLQAFDAGTSFLGMKEGSRCGYEACVETLNVRCFEETSQNLAGGSLLLRYSFEARPKLHFELRSKSGIEYLPGPGNLTHSPQGGGLKLEEKPFCALSNNNFTYCSQFYLSVFHRRQALGPACYNLTAKNSQSQTTGHIFWQGLRQDCNAAH